MDKVRSLPPLPLIGQGLTWDSLSASGRRREDGLIYHVEGGTSGRVGEPPKLGGLKVGTYQNEQRDSRDGRLSRGGRSLLDAPAS